MSDKTRGTDLSRTVANILAMAGYQAAGNTERKEGGCFRWFDRSGRKFLVIEDQETVAVLEVVGTTSDSERMIAELRGRISS